MRSAEPSPTNRPTLIARFLTTLLTLLALLLLGACSDTPEPEARLASASFERQGNLICTQLDTQIEQILEDRTDEFGRPTPEAYPLMREARANAFDALFALEPPLDSEADLAHLKAIREEWTATLNARVPEPDADLRLGPQMDDAFRQLNFHDCI